MLINNIFNSLLKSSNFFSIVYPHIKSDYFYETHHKKLFDVIQSYHKKYNKVPTSSALKLLIETDTSISESLSEELYSYIDSLKKVEKVEDEELIIKETENYIKQKALELAALEYIRIVQDPKESNGKIEDIIKEALSIEFNVKIGHDYYNDALERLKWYNEDEHKIPVDIEVMNIAMGGGLVRKAMFIILSSTNTGKCQKFDTKILMEDGSYKTIEYLYNNQKYENIITMADNHKLEVGKIASYYDSGIIDCYRLETKDGIYTEPSSIHPYYTLSGWKPVSDLKVGDKIAVAKQYNTFNNIDNNMPIEHAVLLGLLLADGCISKHCGFSNIDEELLSLFKNLCLTISQDLNFRYSDNTLHVSSSTRENNKNPMNEFIRSYNLFGANSHTKFIPEEIFTSSKQKISKFLGAFYACDGWVSNSKQIEVGVSLCNKNLLLQIRSLLLRFGIKSRILKSSATHTKGGSRFIKYSLIIRDYYSIKLFYENINIPLTYKQQTLSEYVQTHENSKNRSSYTNNFPSELWDIIRSILSKQNISLTTLSKKIHENLGKISCYNMRVGKNISFYLLSLINDVLKDDFLQSLLDGDIVFDEITSLEYIGKHQCYDLTIDDTHNFIANDMIVHNTVNLCHYASGLQKSGNNVLYITGEESEREILIKNDANLLDINISDLNKNLDKDVFKDRFKKLFKSNHGQFIVKEYPTGTANANHIKNLLRELRVKKNFVPDVVVLDGLNNFASHKIPSSQSGTPIYVKSVAEEQRALASEFDFALLTNAQFNRGAKSKGADAGLEDIGEAYAIAQTADWSCSLIQTDELRSQNKYLIKNLKTRFGKNKGSVYTIGINYDRMRLINLSEADQELPIHLKDKLKSQKEKEDKEEESNLFQDFDFEN